VIIDHGKRPLCEAQKNKQIPKLFAMKRILTIIEAIKMSKTLRSEGKQIVLAGGCFDILHPGHIAFIEKAKEKGDILIILLESDEKINERKVKTGQFMYNKNGQ